MNEKLRQAGPSTNGDDFWGGGGRSTRGADSLGVFRTVLQYRWPIIGFTVLVAALAVAFVQTVEPRFRSTQALLLESNTTGVAAAEGLVREAPDAEGYVVTQVERLRSRAHAERVIESLELLAEPVFVRGVADRAGVPAADMLRALGLAPATAERAGASSDTGASDAADSSTPRSDDAIRVDDIDAASGAGDGRPADARLADRRFLLPLAIDHLLARLSVEAVPTTRLVRVSYLSPDAVLAARVANGVGLQYLATDLESSRDAADEVSSWLSTRLDALRSTLDASERALREFKVENDLVDVGGNVGSLAEQSLVNRTQELTDARLELANLGFLRDELQAATGNADLLARLPPERVDPVLQDTRAEINRLQQELDGLSNQYGPRHPRVVDVRSRIDTLEESLGVSLRSAVAGVQNQYDLLARRVSAIENELVTERSTLQDVDAKTAELIALESEVQTNRELYYRFFSRLSEAQSTEDLDQVSATVVERATPALQPAEPNKPFIIALSTFGALLLAVLGALVVSGLDDSIRRRADVEERLGQRLLGLVPTYREPPSGLTRLLPWQRRRAEKRNRMFHEAFRSLRARLTLGHDPDANRVILVTSSVPGEGKSMSSVCLARAFAQVERVLLIDADVRRPSLARALSLPAESPGLTQLIADHAELRECIRHHPGNGFDVLPSGPITDQPLEMLASTRFAALLDQLARQYDRVIVDSAPVEAVSDALPVARLVDGLVYVVKSHDTSARLAASGLAKLAGVDAPVLGVLLTQVDLDKLAAYGADYEFHGYYDYYDYAAPAVASGFNLDRDELRQINLRGAARHDAGRAPAESKRAAESAPSP